MQTEPIWNLEDVLRLGSRLLVCIALGMFGSLALEHWRPHMPLGQQRFYGFLISSASFQLAGLILTHFFLRAHGLRWTEFLGLHDPDLARWAGFASLTGILVLPGTYLLSRTAEVLLTLLQGPPDTQPTVQVFQLSVTLPQRISFGFAAIILAPLIEEILFRGILYRAIKQLGWPRSALVSTSILFGLIHGSALTLVPLAFLSVVLALLYDRTNNLLAPILTHSVFNSVNFVLLILMP